MIGRGSSSRCRTERPASTNNGNDTRCDTKLPTKQLRKKKTGAGEGRGGRARGEIKQRGGRSRVRHTRLRGAEGFLPLVSFPPFPRRRLLLLLLALVVRGASGGRERQKQQQMLAGGVGRSAIWADRRRLLYNHHSNTKRKKDDEEKARLGGVALCFVSLFSCLSFRSGFPLGLFRSFLVLLYL